MAKHERKKEEIKVGALGENLETNKPENIGKEVGLPSDLPEEPEMMGLEEPEQPGPKEQPETWPFNKSNVSVEKKEMEHVSRLINMKYDNPGVKYITKVVVFDCQGRQVVCEDYRLEY